MATFEVKRAPGQRFGVSIGGRNQIFNLDVDGACAAAGLAMGDVLLSVDGESLPAGNGEDWLFGKMREASADKALTIVIQRAASTPEPPPPAATEQTEEEPKKKGFLGTLFEMVMNCGPLAKMPVEEDETQAGVATEEAPQEVPTIAADLTREVMDKAIAASVGKVPSKIFHVCCPAVKRWRP